MAAPASHLPFPPEAWPTLELKRYPNGEMGVLMEIPAPPDLQKHGIDVLGALIEPQRALRLRSNLDELLDVMGMIGTSMPLAEGTSWWHAKRGTKTHRSYATITEIAAEGRVVHFRYSDETDAGQFSGKDTLFADNFRLCYPLPRVP
jgi:uncharacterized protein YhdP